MGNKYLCMVDGIAMKLTKVEALEYCALKIPIQVIEKLGEENE